MKVKTGRGTCDEPEFISVPIRIGSRDRVVAAIEAGNTQNKLISVPMLAAQMTGLTMSPNRKGVGVVDRRVSLPVGGIFPDDLKTIVRVMPIPYIMNVELDIYASSTQQLHQILEQLLILFDPQLQIQTTDATFDWTKITTVTLSSIVNGENYPAGENRRVISWTLGFDVPIYISAPLDVSNDVVKKITITYGDLDGFTPDEVNEDGSLAPFLADFTYGISEITPSIDTSAAPPPVVTVQVPPGP